MNGFLLAVLVFLGGLGMTAMGDMVSEEVRDRLDHLPQAVLRLAALRLDPAQRVTVYEDDWLPELDYILRGDEARPITRLITGTWFAVSILAKARTIRRDLPPATQAASNTLPDLARHGKPDLILLDGAEIEVKMSAINDTWILHGDPGQRGPFTRCELAREWLNPWFLWLLNKDDAASRIEPSSDC